MKTSKEMQAFAIAGLDAEIARLTRLRQELVGGAAVLHGGKRIAGKSGTGKAGSAGNSVPLNAGRSPSG